VFTIIVTWIDLEKIERKELFREVWLVYVSGDFLQSVIATNDLVNANEGWGVHGSCRRCLDLLDVH